MYIVQYETLLRYLMSPLSYIQCRFQFTCGLIVFVCSCRTREVASVAVRPTASSTTCTLLRQNLPPQTQSQRLRWLVKVARHTLRHVPWVLNQDSCLFASSLSLFFCFQALNLQICFDIEFDTL